MRITKNFSFLLLGIWLILSGLMPFGLSFPNESVLLAILAIAAGVMVLFSK
jgi:hypothetical protein